MRNSGVEVRRAIHRALDAWPVLVAQSEFFREHVERLSVSTPQLAQHGHELYLAFSCARANPEALNILERQYVLQLTSTIARVDTARGFVDEVFQTLRERLLLGNQPRIAQYAATGPLKTWLRVSALRLALNCRRGLHNHREMPLDAIPELARVSSPESEAYRESVQQALRQAFAALTERQRNVLRLHYVEILNIDEIGDLYKTHRATAARWIVRAREQILDAVKTQVQTQFELSCSEVNTVLAGVRSKLDISVLRLLQDTAGV